MATSNQSDAKYLLAAFLPLCFLLAYLTLHFRQIASEGHPDLVDFKELIGRDIEFTTGFYGLRYHGYSDNWIDAHILYFGAFAKFELQFLDDLAAAIGDGSVTFVDVGANTGQHTIFASRFSKIVYAFEPFPPILMRLQNMVGINDLTNVSVEPVALGVRDEVLDFHPPPPDNQGMGSFVKDFGPAPPEVMQLQVVNGDDYFKQRGIVAVDVMKIDVEGFEKSVLEGLRETIASQRPVIVMELTVNDHLDQLFKSEQELRQSLPENYNLAVLEAYPDSKISGRYFLTEFAVDFNIDVQSTVIGIPTELDAKIPRRGSATRRTN